MPYYRTPGTVRRAVDAVLAQTYTDLVLVVVNDGDTDTPPWPHLVDVDDDRLVRVDLPINRGRYFCDAAVLAAAPACRESRFAIHDSDDEAEPDWLRRLVDACEPAGVVAAVCPQYVHGARATVLEPVVRPVVARPGRLRHLAHHAGVYRTDVAQRVGGHPAFRVGFDSLWVNVLAMLGTVAVVDRPLYHRHIRSDSLTTARATGRGSTARHAARRALEVLYASCLAADDPAQRVRDDVPTDLASLVAQAAQGILDGSLAVTGVPGRTHP